MKLYNSASSPNSRRVRIFLAEKGLSIPLVTVDLGKGEQHSDAYRSINPRRVVPTLVLEDGTAIGEVPAICRYIEESHPTPPLLGETAKEKAQVSMWERRAELGGFAVVMEAIRNSVPGLKSRAIAGPHDYEQISELAERSQRTRRSSSKHSTPCSTSETTRPLNASGRPTTSSTALTSSRAAKVSSTSSRVLPRPSNMSRA